MSVKYNNTKSDHAAKRSTFIGNEGLSVSFPTVGYITPAIFQKISFLLSGGENLNDRSKVHKMISENK